MTSFNRNTKNTLTSGSFSTVLVQGEPGKEKIVFSDLFTTTETVAEFSLLETDYLIIDKLSLSKSVPYRIGHKFIVKENDRLIAFRPLDTSQWGSYSQTDWINMTQLDWESLSIPDLPGKINCSISFIEKNT